MPQLERMLESADNWVVCHKWGCRTLHISYHAWAVINSLAPGKFEWNFRYVIFKRISVIDGWGIFCEIGLIWMSQDFTDDQSILVQVMAWCLYADDTQLYISFQPGVSVSKETAISCLEACIKDIKIWMTNNLLRLNDDKTELIVITTHSNTS